MSHDTKTREAERVALAGGVDEAGIARRLKNRAAPPKPTEVRHTFRAPYCAQCGEIAESVRVLAFVGVETRHPERYYPEQRRKDVAGNRVLGFTLGRTAQPASAEFEGTEDALREGDPDDPMAAERVVSLRCTHGHVWETRLVAVWLEPLPEVHPMDEELGATVRAVEGAF